MSLPKAIQPDRPPQAQQQLTDIDFNPPLTIESLSRPPVAVTAPTSPSEGKITTVATAALPATIVQSSSDLRARLTPLDPSAVYQSGGILDILNTTNGLVFPYTPIIAFSQAVNYADVELVHSNSDFPSYTRTPTCTLSITAKFSVQSQLEGRYALAAIHFLRSVSKSYFGEKDAATGKAGLPPPVLLFSAYGTYIFNEVRVVLKSHSWSFDEGMDTVLVKLDASHQVRLPALFSIQAELMVVQTPQRMRQIFNFADFASGKLMEGGGWA